MRDKTFAFAKDAIIRVTDLIAVTPLIDKNKKKNESYILHYENGESILIERNIMKKLRKLLSKHAKLLARDHCY